MSARIQILTVGRRNHIVGADVLRYAGMISRWAHIDIDCCKGGGDDDAAPVARQRDGIALQSRIDAQSYCIALDPEGTQMDSRKFAQWLSQLHAREKKLVFIIGGAWGLCEEIKKMSRARISLSRLTFPHALCATILMEQLYRAFTICSSHPYHK
jgi:23S rRNA (pseudouridine1915-N3)-methyltransferase